MSRAVVIGIALAAVAGVATVAIVASAKSKAPASSGTTTTTTTTGGAATPPATVTVVPGHKYRFTAPTPAQSIDIQAAQAGLNQTVGDASLFTVTSVSVTNGMMTLEAIYNGSAPVPITMPNVTILDLGMS